MLKIITCHAFQAFGIYMVYINILNWMTNRIFELTTDTSLLPYFFILSACNLFLRQEETMSQHSLPPLKRTCSGAVISKL